MTHVPILENIFHHYLLISLKNSKLPSFQKRFTREKTENVEAEQETQTPIRSPGTTSQSAAANRSQITTAPSTEGELSDLCQGTAGKK